MEKSFDFPLECRVFAIHALRPKTQRLFLIFRKCSENAERLNSERFRQILRKLIYVHDWFLERLLPKKDSVCLLCSSMVHRFSSERRSFFAGISCIYRSTRQER